MIRLIGPGGAGKSTTGVLLATRLHIPFIDLDCRFSNQHGDVGEFIRRHGYNEYARRNVETYRSVLQAADSSVVLALSSGFMTYADAVHPDHRYLREDIVRSPYFCPRARSFSRRAFLRSCADNWIGRSPDRVCGRRRSFENVFQPTLACPHGRSTRCVRQMQSLARSSRCSSRREIGFAAELLSGTPRTPRTQRHFFEESISATFACSALGVRQHDRVWDPALAGLTCQERRGRREHRPPLQTSISRAKVQAGR
jgi:hypothetical protein